MKRNCHGPSSKCSNVGPCTVFYLAAEMTDLGNASDSDVDPLGGVHRGAGHSQGHRVQGHPATTNQIYSDTFILYCALLFFEYDLQYLHTVAMVLNCFQSQLSLHYF